MEVNGSPVLRLYLLFHQLPQTCGLARNPCRKPRGKGIRTKGNSIKDIIVEIVVKDGFSYIATVVGNKTSTSIDAPLSETRALYNFIGGGRVRIQKLSQGLPEQNAGPAEPSTAKDS